ncbi:MAG: Copper binding protein plastocyanin/azurin family [Thermoplasmata archaeon]|jgi:plastocyanin|nr:Copper binding protein plastocyanin/azurin family [Thermoplasmata archaeon]
MRPILLLLAATLLAPLALAQPTPDPGACVQESATVESCDVQIHELPSGSYHVLPERINVAEGETLKLHVENRGNSTHNLMFCGDGVDPTTSLSPTCKDVWTFTNDIAAHAEKNVTISSVSKAGTFYYFCTKPGHANNKMYGEMIVASSGAAKKSGGEAALGAILALVAVALVVRRR